MSTSDIIKAWEHQNLVPSDSAERMCIVQNGVTVGGFTDSMSRYLAYHRRLPEERETVFTWLAKRSMSKDALLKLMDVLASGDRSNYAIAVVGFSPISALYQLISEYEAVYVVDPDDVLIEHRMGVYTRGDRGMYSGEDLWDKDFVDAVLLDMPGALLAVSKGASRLECQTASRLECQTASWVWANGVNLIYRVDTTEDRAYFFQGLEEVNQRLNSGITDYAYVLECRPEGTGYTITFEPYTG